MLSFGRCLAVDVVWAWSEKNKTKPSHAAHKGKLNYAQRQQLQLQPINFHTFVYTQTHTDTYICTYICVRLALWINECTLFASCFVIHRYMYQQQRCRKCRRSPPATRYGYCTTFVLLDFSSALCLYVWVLCECVHVPKNSIYFENGLVTPHNKVESEEVTSCKYW